MFPRQPNQCVWFLAVFLQSVLFSKTFCDIKMNHRLHTAERKLDIINSEISQFREEVFNIWETLQELNTTICLKPNSKTDLDNANHNFEVENQEFSTRIEKALKDEKQMRLDFEHSFKTQLQNFQNQTDKALAEVKTDMNQIVNRITVLEENAENTTNETVSINKKELVALIVQNAELKLKHQNLLTTTEYILAINEKIQEKIRLFEGCAPGWVQHERSCYYIPSGNIQMDWYEAQKRCHEYHAHLVEFKDTKEMQFVTNMTLKQIKDSKQMQPVANVTESFFWVGADPFLTITETSRQTRWSISLMMVEHKIDWLITQLTESLLNCLTIYRNEDILTSFPCNFPLKFICEQDLFL